MYTQEEYHKYLQTIDWQYRSKTRAKIDDYKCCMCNCIGTQNNPLQAHHITYKNIFHEDVYKDLVTLCRNCHKAVHKMMNRKTSASGQRGWKDTITLANHVLQDSKEPIERIDE